MQSSAIISDCGTYRYLLSRRWGEGSPCVFVMLNPSTADASVDDATIRKCIGFARRLGPDILGHLRGSGPHARGCHVLDLVLGKS